MSYEFRQEHNELIGSLAGKMRLVGFFNLLLGILYLLAALLLMVFIFQDRLPSDLVARIPEDVRARIPSSANHLWAVFIQTGVVALIFLAIGAWTRSAAASFGEIVTTTGRDVGHLMNALASLRKMYSLMYTLIIIMILVLLASLILQLYLRYAA